MKQTIMTLALCALCAGASAQTVTVGDVEALPGETVAFVLNLTDGKADTYTAMQFDVQFPATGFTTTGKYSVSELWENATAVVGSVDASGTATIPVASSEAISAANVEGLLTVSFTVGSDVALGEYDVTLTNLWFGYGTSSKDYLDDVTFTVHVVARHTVVLDENSTEAPSETEDVNVRVLRTINADEWSTICLPFAMTSKQVAAAFGYDVQIADFTGCETEEDDDENIIAISIGFSDVTAMEAHHPYIIKVPESLTEFSVSGVDITEAKEGELQVDRNELEYTYTVGKKTYTGYMYNSFVGTYVAQATVPSMSLFLSDNQFWYSTGSTKMKAFRAYFDFYDVLTEVEDAYSSRIKMHFDDTEQSGISETENQKSVDSKCFDLLGRCVEHPDKGLFIRDGKKIVVR